ncbi:hypothetical protein EG327_004819 [Venturia inaequalis]|uniref:Uncharacterized protein n=1 Tax=Venturia inaequalis TaxID=5025 RepID=A0A8H3VCE7_VENIN|nr:hypothetical protein EG327_004819 [Venturia inaequalis]
MNSVMEGGGASTACPVATLFIAISTDFASRWTVARMKKLFEMRKPRDERNPHQAKTVGRPKGAPNRRQQGTRQQATRTSSSRMLPQGTEPRDLSRVEHTHRNPASRYHHDGQVHDGQVSHDGQVTTPEPTQDLGFEAVRNGPTPIDAQNHGPPPPPPSDDATGPANNTTEASRKRARAATVQSTSQSTPAALQSTSVALSKKPRGRPRLTDEQKAHNAREKKVKKLQEALVALNAGPSG